jgi:hypothetical protein
LRPDWASKEQRGNSVSARGWRRLHRIAEKLPPHSFRFLPTSIHIPTPEGTDPAASTGPAARKPNVFAEIFPGLENTQTHTHTSLKGRFGRNDGCQQQLNPQGFLPISLLSPLAFLLFLGVIGPGTLVHPLPFSIYCPATAVFKVRMSTRSFTTFRLPRPPFLRGGSFGERQRGENGVDAPRGSPKLPFLGGQKLLKQYRVSRWEGRDSVQDQQCSRRHCRERPKPSRDCK